MNYLWAGLAVQPACGGNGLGAGGGNGHGGMAPLRRSDGSSDLMRRDGVYLKPDSGEVYARR